MYIGIDVHKDVSNVAVMDDTGQYIEEVRVDNADLEDVAQRYAGASAAIEATTNYYHIHDTLSEHLDVTVAHPGELRLIAESDKKTDSVDARQLARLVRLNAVPESYVPTDEIRECRALVRGRKSLIEDRTKYVNRVKGLLTDYGFTRNVKPLSKKGREALRDLSLPTPADTLVESHLTIIEELSAEITRLEELIDEYAASLEETQLLMSIPGVAEYSAMTILAEIGEIDRFDTDKALVSYAGLNPSIRESNGSRIEGGVSKKGSKHLRWILVQCAHVAVHTCNDPYLKRFYDRLASRKTSKEAIVATARKMLVSIYHMLDRKEVYDPPGVSS